MEFTDVRYGKSPTSEARKDNRAMATSPHLRPFKSTQANLVARSYPCPWACLVLTVLSLSIVGCAPKKSPDRVPDKATPADAEPQTVTDSQPATGPEAPSPQASAPPSPEVSAASSPTTDVAAGNETMPVNTEGGVVEGMAEQEAVAESEDVTEHAATAAPAERIMLLSDAGPILIDVHITIGDVPHRESFSNVIQEVMAIADDDKDGLVSWEQLIAHPRFSQGQFGNPASTTYQAQQQMIRLYDTTKNDRVDQAELVRYLSSGQSTSQALSLYTSNYRRIQNRDGSPIRKWLDVNDDLTLDAAEIDNASHRLRLRDTNDDEVLLVADFAESTGSQNNMVARRRPRDSDYLPKVGWHLQEGDQWSDVRVAWSDFFALGQQVQASDLNVTSDLFVQLDLDSDESLDNVEMEMLMDVEPHISLDVKIAKVDGEKPTVALSALRLPPESINAIVQKPNRLTLNLEKTSLDIFVKDILGQQPYDEQAKNFLRQGDGDKNEYLDDEEFQSVAQFFNNADFSAVDLDDDKKIVLDELVTILRQRNIVSRNQVSIRADDQDDALMPTLDLNSDGRIDSREISLASQTLRSLDHNEDGEVQLHEMRGSMMLGIVRGGNRGTIMQGDATFQVPQAIRKPSESTPRWFTSMDRNQDQGISWREFLGTRQQFQELDENEDGFVSADEVMP